MEAPAASRLGWPAAVVLALLAVILYGPALRNGYVFDDVTVVRDNPVVKGLRWSETLTGPYWPALPGVVEGSSNWRPLATLSWLVERAVLPGAAPLVHHASNALLHGLAVLALFPLARRFAGDRWPVLAALALFAVHPAHTEVVPPVVGRTDLLAALGVLAGLECFLRHRDGGSAAWLGLGTAAYVIGLGGKESAAPLLLLLPAADWLLRGRPLRSLAGRETLAYLPYAAVAAAYLAARIAVLGDSSFAHEGAVEYTVGGRLVFAARNAVISAGLLVLPIRFHHLVTTLPDNAPFTYPDPEGLAAAAWTLGGLVVGLGWIVLVRRAPRAAFLWLAALATWLPASGLLPAAAGVSLRFLLLPTAFLACAIGMGLDRLAARRPPLGRGAGAAACVVVLAGAATCVWRTLQWRNNGTFSRAVLAERPDCYTAHVSLGTWLAGRRPPQIEAARAHYREAILVAGDDPRSFEARLNLAISLEMGVSGGRYSGPGVRLDEARRAYRDLIDAFPDRWEPYLNLAVVLDQQHADVDARRAYERFLERFPEHPRAADVRARLEELGD